MDGIRLWTRKAGWQQPAEDYRILKVLSNRIPAMTTPKRDLFLISGIPGTGKTWYGDKFVEEFGFLHYDLEEQQTLNRFASNPAQFIADAVSQKRNVVVTWGFVPDHQPSIEAVLQFRNSGFKLIWFDGNRAAALREFQKRGDGA